MPRGLLHSQMEGYWPKAPTLRYLLRSADFERPTPMCPFQGAYTKVPTAESALPRGTPPKEVNQSKTPTKGLLRGAHSKVLALKLPTPNYPPPAVYSEVPTSDHLNRD